MRCPVMSRRVLAVLPVAAVVVVLGFGIRAGESGPAAPTDDRAGLVRARAPRFSVTLQLEEVGVQGVFQEISGLGSENEVVEIREGGQNVIRKVPGVLKWGDVTLKRGISGDASLWQWRRMVESGNFADARANGTIALMDRGSVIATWHLTNAWPAKISGPTLDGKGNDVAVEVIVIAHEGMRRE